MMDVLRGSGESLSIAAQFRQITASILYITERESGRIGWSMNVRSMLDWRLL